MRTHYTYKLVSTFLLVLLASSICLANPTPETTLEGQENNGHKLLYLTIFLRNGEVISFDTDHWDTLRFDGKFGLISYEQLKQWKETQWIVAWPEITSLLYSIDLINTNLERYDRDKILVTGQNGEQVEMPYGGLSYGDPEGICCPEYFIYQEYNPLIKKWVDIHVPIKHIQKIVLGTTNLMVNPANCKKYPPDYRFDPNDGAPLVFYTHSDVRIKCEEDPGALKDLIEKLQKERDQFEACCKKLTDDLADEIARREAAVKKCKEGVTVSVIGKVLFEFGKADLTPAGKKLLSKIAKGLKNTGDRKIKVVGHTDNVPISRKHRHIFPSNWELSTARAAAVVNYFQTVHGIDPARLEASGRSDLDPVVSNDTPEGREQNRRVEITVQR